MNEALSIVAMMFLFQRMKPALIVGHRKSYLRLTFYTRRISCGIEPRMIPARREKFLFNCGIFCRDSLTTVALLSPRFNFAIFSEIVLRLPKREKALDPSDSSHGTFCRLKSSAFVLQLRFDWLRTSSHFGKRCTISLNNAVQS